MHLPPPAPLVTSNSPCSPANVSSHAWGQRPHTVLTSRLPSSVEVPTATCHSSQGLGCAPVRTLRGAPVRTLPHSVTPSWWDTPVPLQHPQHGREVLTSPLQRSSALIAASLLPAALAHPDRPAQPRRAPPRLAAPRLAAARCPAQGRGSRAQVYSLHCGPPHRTCSAASYSTKRETPPCGPHCLACTNSSRPTVRMTRTGSTLESISCHFWTRRSAMEFYSYLALFVHFFR